MSGHDSEYISKFQPRMTFARHVANALVGLLLLGFIACLFILIFTWSAERAAKHGADSGAIKQDVPFAKEKK